MLDDPLAESELIAGESIASCSAFMLASLVPTGFDTTSLVETSFVPSFLISSVTSSECNAPRLLLVLAPHPIHA
eukprot:8380473-Pyramimonas_sp.AAC.1